MWHVFPMQTYDLVEVYPGVTSRSIEKDFCCHACLLFQDSVIMFSKYQIDRFHYHLATFHEGRFTFKPIVVYPPGTLEEKADTWSKIIVGYMRPNTVFSRVHDIRRHSGLRKTKSNNICPLCLKSHDRKDRLMACTECHGGMYVFLLRKARYLPT
jgi:hypothetical protein